ncbi:hypothetical protein [Mangrovibrevibacter kandeliae]|uniref:hypothetical protein n=1 Tax=Mangrovibrevibacter kandeliae TaxID=2968473 RepID=UPI002117EC8A|nr:hypothetical protein [Aurantimonas sp. CSK15Z-1]MCQ8783008.1 hypothetical protein [Aurantimonas sp. CSK15Z-1]
MGALADFGGSPRTVGPRDRRMRLARTCYDHMAGRLAVGLAGALEPDGLVILSDEGGLVTQRGLARFGEVGLDLGPPDSRRPLCRTCLDWSERRLHIGGRLGRALLDHAQARRWVEAAPDGRALSITGAGRSGLRDVFGLDVAALEDDAPPARSHACARVASY